MFYREAGDFLVNLCRKTSQTFPIKFDRWRYYAVLFDCHCDRAVHVMNDYWVNARSSCPS